MSDGDTVPTPGPEPPRRWRNPPCNQLPTIVAVEAVLARTDDVAVALSGASVDREGIELSLLVYVRDPSTVSAVEALGGRSSTSKDQCLLGIEYADGRTATNFDDHWRGDDADALVLAPHGGGGTRGFSRYGFYLTPLPPPGPVAVIISWPAAGVNEHRVEIDAELFRSAATQALTLWPEQPARTVPLPPPELPHIEPGGWFDQYRSRPA